jgi:hypothetical protein
MSTDCPPSAGQWCSVNGALLLRARGRELYPVQRSVTQVLCIACLVAGIGFLTIADSGWGYAVGVLCLLAFIVVAFPAALPPDVVPAPIKNRTVEKTSPR